MSNGQWCQTMFTDMYQAGIFCFSALQSLNIPFMWISGRKPDSVAAVSPVYSLCYKLVLIEEL